jgi:hypothetical protein
MPAQQFRHVSVLLARCNLKRRQAVIVFGIDLGLVGQQQFHHILVALRKGMRSLCQQGDKCRSTTFFNSFCDLRARFPLYLVEAAEPHRSGGKGEEDLLTK